MNTPSIKPTILSAEAIDAVPRDGFVGTTSGGDVTWKTLLSSSKTPSNTFTTGIGYCAPRGGQLKCHRHTHPEIYYITQGRGILSIDGREQEVGKGAVVFIPGDAEHGIRNVDEEVELAWLYVFAADTFEEVVYRFNEDMPKAKL